MDYIQKIKKLRLENNITQVELSEKLGLSPSAYGLYETYQRQMDIDTFVKICKLFDVTPNYLLGFNHK